MPLVAGYSADAEPIGPAAVDLASRNPPAAGVTARVRTPMAMHHVPMGRMGMVC
jgi:hypothetical protein